MALNYGFSLIALIGVILLVGIVKKNAIMMIDFALVAERSRGLTPEQSIYEACLLRYRPIMMTTMAALLGGLPLALGTGPPRTPDDLVRHSCVQFRRAADGDPLVWRFERNRKSRPDFGEWASDGQRNRFGYSRGG